MTAEHRGRQGNITSGSTNFLLRYCIAEYKEKVKLLQKAHSNVFMVRQQLFLIPFCDLNAAVGDKALRDSNVVDALCLVFCKQLDVVIGKGAEQSLSALLRKIVAVGKATVEVAANTQRYPTIGEPLDIVELLDQGLLKRRMSVSINTDDGSINQQMAFFCPQLNTQCGILVADLMLSDTRVICVDGYSVLSGVIEYRLKIC